MTYARAEVVKSLNVATAMFEFPSLGHHENKFSRGLARKYKKCHGA